MSAQKKELSGWLYAGCGCLLIGGLVMVGLGIFGALEIKNLVEEIEDPAARLGKTLEILGIEQLPEGYYSTVALDLPFIMRMVVLTDEPIDGDSPEAVADSFQDGLNSLDNLGDIDADRAFFYMMFKIEPDQDDRAVFERTFESSEELGRGEVQIGEQKLIYRAHRGDNRKRRDEESSGVFATMEIVCPDDKNRFAMWFSAVPPEQTDLVGTPADEKALAEFIDQFDLCSIKG